MKNLRLFAVAMTFFALLSVSNAQAQPKEHGNWQDKIKSEKIAFLTAELELTPDEAQVFWPVYNQIVSQKHEAQKNMMKAYFDLAKALEENKATDKEINNLLNNYLAAKLANKDIEKGEADKYRKVLPDKKVAKLYVAEEKFRRHHIRSMREIHGTVKPGQRN